MSKPERWTRAELTADRPGRTVVWAIPAVQRAVSSILPFPVVPALQPLESDVRTLIVVGGGVLLDEAKSWRAKHRSDLCLVAVPSVWGSGAEASSVAVLNRDGRKLITMGPEFLPDARAVLEELAETIPMRRALDGCGDAWAHALEGFLSPLANDALRDELASLIGELAATPAGVDARWFELSARACAAQARSSVGLVHGIAHVLEAPLHAASPELAAGHARLCATFVWPVMSLNRTLSTTWDDLAARFGIDGDRVFQCLEELHDESVYEAALPLLSANWKAVLRDPCSRTNGALIRPEHVSWFTSKEFL